MVADVAETPMLRDLMKASGCPSPPPMRNFRFYRANASQIGPNAVFKKTDVSDWKQLDELFSFATATYGPVDLMCNGAGIYEPVDYLP